MSKGLSVAIIVGILLVAGAGAYIVLNRPSDTTAPGTSASASPAPTSALQPQSLRDLLALGRDQTCTFNDASGNSGSVYMGGAKVRGDFTTMVNSQPQASHMLVDGQTVYVWMDGQAQGFKVSFDAVADLGSSTSNQSVDLDQKVDYQCSDWAVDDSKFSLPSGVIFSDTSAMMAPALTGVPQVTGTSEDRCAACDALTGAPQAQCLQALGCN